MAVSASGTSPRGTGVDVVITVDVGGGGRGYFAHWASLLGAV